MIVSPRSSSLASLSTVSCVGSPAGTMIQTIRGALELLDELRQRAGAGRAVLDRLLDRLLVEVERDDLVLGVAADAVHHVAAHLAQPDEADLRHSASLMLVGQGAQRARGVIAVQAHALGRQPELAQRLEVADRLAFLSVVKVYGGAGDLHVLAARRAAAAGSARSSGRPCGTGPVECRKRGP